MNFLEMIDQVLPCFQFLIAFRTFHRTAFASIGDNATLVKFEVGRERESLSTLFALVLLL